MDQVNKNPLVPDDPRIKEQWLVTHDHTYCEVVFDGTKTTLIPTRKNHDQSQNSDSNGYRITNFHPIYWKETQEGNVG